MSCSSHIIDVAVVVVWMFVKLFKLDQNCVLKANQCKLWIALGTH